jgi:hypothetical protein
LHVCCCCCCCSHVDAACWPDTRYGNSTAAMAGDDTSGEDNEEALQWQVEKTTVIIHA